MSQRLANPAAERGGVLVVALIALLLAVSLAFASASLATSRRDDVVRDERGLQARAAAEAGVHRAIAWAQELAALDSADPFGGIDALAGRTNPDGSPIAFVVADGEALAANRRDDVRLTVAVTARATAAGRELRITATGHVPRVNAPLAAATVHAVVRLESRAAPAFDFAYFVDHWAWLLSDRIEIEGNAGSNGQFDCGDHSPSIAGRPRFQGVSLADPAHPDLIGYLDDNGDGLHDGADGGIFSAFAIVGSDQVRGSGGLQQNQHAFGAPVAMPRLHDLAPSEAAALAHGSSLAIGGGLDGAGQPLPPIPVCDAILGDEAGELQHLVLIGTPDQPILLDGPVVVRGDVILKGVVSGVGSIHAGGNLYVADDLTYLNGPPSWIPAGTTEADLEAWLAAFAGADFCGLYARENVVVGDFTDADWRDAVQLWLDDPANESAEDAGIDGVPGTSAGKDGVPGTADDDVLEGDGIFTVEHYTAEHEALGLLPPGKAVGDPIPGTGEDVDGDGVYDDRLTLADFDLEAALDSGEWAGNLPAGIAAFADLASDAVTTIEAVLATNHAAAMASFATGCDFELRGSLVARIEAMVAATDAVRFRHDPRLMGGGTLPGLLPQRLAPPRILAWQWSREDLKRVLDAAADPAP